MPPVGSVGAGEVEGVNVGMREGKAVGAEGDGVGSGTLS